jgi:hypothetical protein
MRYMASIYISDVMDQIAATIEVQGWEAQYGPPEVVYQDTVITPGYGDDDASRWLHRALEVVSQTVNTRPLGAERGRVVEGGPHTISDTGDSAA